jgi:hypothetical protein
VHTILDETAIALARLTFVTAAVVICATTLRKLVRG